jgi:zona occludens toxin (predicted ATPase)
MLPWAKQEADVHLIHSKLIQRFKVENLRRNITNKHHNLEIIDLNPDYARTVWRWARISPPLRVLRSDRKRIQSQMRQLGMATSCAGLGPESDSAGKAQ